jgi:hypothetical protein
MKNATKSSEKYYGVFYLAMLVKKLMLHEAKACGV